MDPIKPADFWEMWSEYYGSAPPLAHILRERLPDRWFRAHTLPSSKRHADTQNELRIILSRYRALSEQVLSAGEPAALIVAYAHGEELSGVGRPVVDRGDVKVLGRWDEPEGGEPTPWTFYGRDVLWDFDAEESVWKEKVEGKNGQVVVVSAATGQIFAPYDGGCDLFVASASRVASLRSQFREWLSNEPSGL